MIFFLILKFEQAFYKLWPDKFLASYLQILRNKYNKVDFFGLFTLFLLFLMKKNKCLNIQIRKYYIRKKGALY